VPEAHGQHGRASGLATSRCGMSPELSQLPSAALLSVVPCHARVTSKLKTRGATSRTTNVRPWRANPSHGGDGSWHAAPDLTSLFCFSSSIHLPFDYLLVSLELHMFIWLINQILVISYFVDRNMYESCLDLVGSSSKLDTD
jgi:hypothetical protein